MFQPFYHPLALCWTHSNSFMSFCAVSPRAECSTPCGDSQEKRAKSPLLTCLTCLFWCSLGHGWFPRMHKNIANSLSISHSPSLLLSAVLNPFSAQLVSVLGCDSQGCIEKQVLLNVFQQVTYLAFCKVETSCWLVLQLNRCKWNQQSLLRAKSDPSTCSRSQRL